MRRYGNCSHTLLAFGVGLLCGCILPSGCIVVIAAIVIIIFAVSASRC